MAINIERLLRLAADYHNFCSDEQNSLSEELDEEELELIAAAGCLTSFASPDDKTESTQAKYY